MERVTDFQLLLAGTGLAIGGMLILRALSDEKDKKINTGTLVPENSVPVAVTEPTATVTEPAALRRAFKRGEFHLRQRPTRTSEGQLVQGMMLDLIEDTPIQRNREVLWKVRTPNGVVGWAFISPGEIIS